MPSKFGPYRVTGLRFDDKKLVRLMTAAERQWLGFAGAMIRREARGRIRKKKNPAAPGRPPRSVTGKLKRGIFFAVEPTEGRVVVGPAKLAGSASGGRAPGVLEHGGAVVLNLDRRGEMRHVYIEARPYMGPALEKIKPKLADLWRDRLAKRGT